MGRMIDGGPEGLLYDDAAASAFGASIGNWDFDNKRPVDDDVEILDWIVKDAEAKTSDGTIFHIIVNGNRVEIPGIHTNLPDGIYTGGMLTIKWAWCQSSKYTKDGSKGRDNLKYWTIVDSDDDVPSYCQYHKILVSKLEYSKQIFRDDIINKVLSLSI